MTVTPAANGSPAPGSPQAKLQKAAHDLESVFYGQLFEAMRASVPEGGVIQQSTGEKMFSSMMDDEVAKMASNQTDRGLAHAIYQELNRKLQAEPAAAATTPSVTST